MASICTASAEDIDNVTDIVGDDFSHAENCLNLSEDSSPLEISTTSANRSFSNLTLNEGSYDFIDCAISNLTVNNATVRIANSTISHGGIVVNGGNVTVQDSIFTNCDVAVLQSGGDLRLTGNIIANNTIGVNVTGGVADLSFNMLYYNHVSLVYNSTSIAYDNNWWGRNRPVHSSLINDTDILQAGLKSPFNSWLVLSITQSDSLDYDYWIAGVTYYNFTVDLNRNNLGEDVSYKGHVKNFNLTLTHVEKHYYFERYLSGRALTTVISENSSVVDGRGECIFSLGYLTSALTKMNITVLGENYTVNLSANKITPNITYVTPSSNFNDSLSVEIDCEGQDAVIFYTLDGTNPAYSSTRILYTGPFTVNESCTVHYNVIDRWGNFQRDLTGNVVKVGTHNFIAQDSYVELQPFHVLAAKSVSGLNDADFELDDVVEGFVYYDHPFVVKDPCRIYFFYYGNIISNGWPLTEGYPSYIYTYSLDYSVNYIKNSTLTESDAIWSKYQGNANNTGVANFTGPQYNQSSWSNENIASYGSAVVDRDGHIIIGGSDGYLYYLNNQGLVIWRFGTTSRILCTPTIGPDGNIYFANWMDSYVYCISPKGELKWKYHLGDYNTGCSPVFGLDNRLYVISSNSLYSTMFVFKDGVLLQNHSIPYISASTPSVGPDGTLYMVSANHELVVVNYDGSLRSAALIDKSDLLTVIGNNNNQNTQTSVSIGSDGILYVLNYRRSYSMEQFTNDQSAQVTVYYYYAVNAFYLNGTCKWTMAVNKPNGVYEFKEMVSGTPTYYRGVLYITGNDNLIAVNASNGDLLWMREIAHSSSTSSSPLVSADEILYVTSANMVYAYNLKGDLIWQYEIRHSPISYSSPTLVEGGTLIVTTNRGTYAFNDIAANFYYEHVNGTETTIHFFDESTKGNNRYYWTFGDGNVSREKNPIHEYASEGKYRVVLLVEINGTLTLARNTTIEVDFVDITPPSNVDCCINDTLVTGGVFNETQTVSLNATDDCGNLTIYYTVDGHSPINNRRAKIYTGPIEIEINTVLKAAAKDSSGNWGNVTTFKFEITDVINITEEINSTRIGEIQALLDNAEPGSKILFDFGKLENASFIISKPLNLISKYDTKLTGQNNKPVFTFTDDAKGSILNGFNIINREGDGILIKSSTDILIRNCVVDTYKHAGINIIDSEKITVRDSEFVHASDGVIVNGSSDVALNRLTVSRSYDNGVRIVDSRNTTLSNSKLEVNGRYQYSGMANQILLDGSNGTVIKSNKITYGFFAIHLCNENDEVVIDNNTIYEGSGDAILLSNNYSDVQITRNLIDGCFNGINFMGRSQNVVIKQNTIENSHPHSDDLVQTFENASEIYKMADYVYQTRLPVEKSFTQAYNGIVISNPSSNFDEGNVTILDNVIIRNSNFAWDDSKYQGFINAGSSDYTYNLMDGPSSYEDIDDDMTFPRSVKSESVIDTSKYRGGKIDLVVDRIGDSTFRLRLIDRLDNHYLSEIPSFDVSFISGGFVNTVKFVNDSAIAAFDAIAVVSDINVVISKWIKKSVHFDMEISEGFSSTNREYDPGFEEGEAFANPDPIVPHIPEEENNSEHDENAGKGNFTGHGQKYGKRFRNRKGNRQRKRHRDRKRQGQQLRFSQWIGRWEK